MLEQHCTSLAQSRKLYELGFRKPSEFVWRYTYQYMPFEIDGKWDFKKEDMVILQKKNEYIKEENKYMGAYLLSEIMEFLPQYLEPLRVVFSFEASGGRRAVRYRDLHKEENYKDSLMVGDRLVDACFDLLIWCIENGFISVTK